MRPVSVGSKSLDEYRRLGAAGHDRVREEFLITRDLRDHLRLFGELRGAESDAPVAARERN